MVRRIAFLFICFSLLTSCSQKIEIKHCTNTFSEAVPVSEYSWNNEYKDSELIDNLEKEKGLKITTLYQGMSTIDLLFKNTEEFVSKLNAGNISVSYLIGDPKWSRSSTVINWA